MSEEEKKGLPPYKIEIFPSGKVLPTSALAFYRLSNADLMDRYRTHFQEWDHHIKSSRSFITETAVGLKGKALLLGVGNALDIPLATLAEQFDQLTLVEVDQESVVGVVQALPIKSQEKIRIVIDDLTGTLARITTQLDQTTQSGDFVKFLNQADSVVKSNHPSDFNLDGDYSFVCSSLVLTQFASQLHHHMKLMAAKVYAGAEIRADTEGLSLLINLTNFAKECQEKHINLLRRSVSNDGRVYLADTFSEVYLARDPLTQQVNPSSKSMDMIDTGLLSEQLRERFNLIQEKSWIWYRERPPVAITQPTKGSAFQIRAISLKPKL